MRDEPPRTRSDTPTATHRPNRPDQHHSPPARQHPPSARPSYGFVVSDSSAARVAAPYTPDSSVRIPRVSWYVRTALSVLLS